MKELLKKLRAVRQDGCVTIALNTHRTFPDNEADPIRLKNMVKQAADRLYRDFPKREVWPVLENMEKCIDRIDFRHNLDSLVIFASDELGEYVTLPVRVTDKVIIDETFATRDIIRAMQEEYSYYILLLNRNQARLIEAFNDSLVREVRRGFPLDNTYYETDRLLLSMK